jgi:hypothetical protein
VQTVAPPRLPPGRGSADQKLARLHLKGDTVQKDWGGQVYFWWAQGVRGGNSYSSVKVTGKRGKSAGNGRRRRKRELTA